MPLVRVFFNPLDGQDKQEHQVAAGTQIIDFLQAEYPAGFDGHLRVFVGIEEIELDDLDLELTEYDLVTLLVMPVGGIAIGTVILQALIATAIGFVINLIFKPSQPSAYTQESESPVYSLNASRNDARLGDPISSHYGTVSYPPDFASAPYIWYWWGSNDQYVDELLCLGHGKFDIDQIYIGDTPVTAIAPGTVRYWLFDVDQHQRTMGVITDAIWQDVKDSDTPWPFRENVITSPEVENWEFNKDRSEQVDTPTAFAGSAFATSSASGETILGHIANVDSTLDIRVGDTLTLAGTASNNGDFVIGSVTTDVDFPGVMKLFQTEDAAVGFADEDPLSGSTTYELNQVAPDLVAGPFRAQKLGQQVNVIDCDIIFAQGLYRVDGTSGAIKSAAVTMEFTYQMIDESDGSPIGAPIVITQEYYSKKRQPLRFTKTTWTIPTGAYEVTVRRVTPIPDDNRIHDKVTWAGLKGAIVYQATPAYGGVTLMAIRMKATNGMGTAARSRIRVTAKRILNYGDSDNPIVVIKDIWTSSTYGLGRPLDELDLDTMDSFEQQWSVSPKFNGSFDNRSTGFDAMQNVASLAGAKIIQDGGLTSIVLDKVQPVRSAMFTSANTVAGSMEIQYTFDTTNDYDSVQIEYRDATTFQPVFVTYPDTGTTPDTFTLFGCTDDTYALEFATYLYNVKTIRRKSVKFQTELEGLIPRFGDRIAISTTLADWGQSGVVTDIVNDTTFVLDQELDWTVDPKIMLLRSPEGNASSEYTVTQGGSPNIVVFPSVPDVTVNDPQSIEPTSYAFGTTYNLVKDFMMTKMTPKGETIVEIEGQNYVEEIYDGAPPHMGGGYSCSSYGDYVSGLGISYTPTVTNEITELAFPFSTDASVTDGKFRYYSDFIATGLLRTAWDGSVSSGTLAPSDVDLSALYGPSFCGGTGSTQQITCIDGSKSYGPDAMVWPTGADNWGDYIVEALITGHNGGSTITGVITRQSGKRWSVNWGGTNYTLAEPYMGVSLGTSGNDLVISASIISDAGFGYPDLSDSVTVVNKNDTVQLIQVHVTSGEPYDAKWIGNANPDAECLVRDVTIEVWCGGQTLTLSGVQCYGYGRSNGGDLNSTSVATHTIYTAPHSFYTEATLSLLSFSAGVVTDYDSTLGQMAFQQNIK